MRYLSIYSGVAGMDLPAEYLGWEVAAFCESDPFCQQVLGHLWPGEKIYGSDTDLTISRLRDDGIGPIDLILGGPPCQAAAISGKRLGASDPRWRWPQFLRIVRECRPRWMVAENPDGLLSLDGGARIRAIHTELADMGYRTGQCFYGLDALGAPQERDRVFLIGHLADANCERRAGGAGEQWPAGGTQSEDSGGATGVAGSGRPGDWQAEPGVCRQPPKLPRWHPDLPWPAARGQEQYSWEAKRTIAGFPNRAQWLKALGNLCSPAHIYPILKAIDEIERTA